MKHFLSLTIVMLAFAIGASAQAQITGTVIDGGTNESLIGATVVEKGTTNEDRCKSAISDYSRRLPNFLI